MLSSHLPPRPLSSDRSAISTRVGHQLQLPRRKTQFVCPRTTRAHRHTYATADTQAAAAAAMIASYGKVTSRFLILKGRRPGFSCFFPRRNSVLYSCSCGGEVPVPAIASRQAGTRQASSGAFHVRAQLLSSDGFVCPASYVLGRVNYQHRCSAVQANYIPPRRRRFQR